MGVFPHEKKSKKLYSGQSAITFITDELIFLIYQFLRFIPLLSISQILQQFSRLVCGGTSSSSLQYWYLLLLEYHHLEQYHYNHQMWILFQADQILQVQKFPHIYIIITPIFLCNCLIYGFLVQQIDCICIIICSKIYILSPRMGPRFSLFILQNMIFDLFR